jgi:aspartate/methionine/tyrosine aminotransferase
MFSARTRWDRTPNRLASALDEARSAGRTIIDLTESNPTRAGLFDTAPLIAELGHPRGTVYEPEPLGHPMARQAIERYYAARGLALDAANVIVAASTSEAYSWLFGLLADAGDTILIPRPSYPLFGWIGEMKGIALRPYRLRYDADFRIDLDDLRQSIDERTRAIVLVHPNNPTGSFVRRDEADALAEIAREHDLALIVDEVFGDYALDALPPEMLPSFAESRADETANAQTRSRGAPLVFVLSGLSKVLLLPQCKLGWMAVSGDGDLVKEAVARLELIADTYLSVATPVQLALPALLAAQPAIAAAVRARLRQNLAAFDAALKELGPDSPMRRLPLRGGWYATLEVPRLHDDDGWVELLIREDGVLVHPGYFFDFEGDGVLVLSLLPETASFREGVRRLTRRIALG